MDIEYKIGMRVRDRYDRTYFGEVIEVVNEHEVHVRWDLESDRIQRHEPCEIRTYDPSGDKARAILAQAKVDEATSLLEAAFKAWREAQKICVGGTGDGTASELRNFENVDVIMFETAVEDAGWDTSSLYC